MLLVGLPARAAVMLTPCGLAVPETEVLRLPDEFGYMIGTHREGMGKGVSVVILDTLLTSPDYRQVESRIWFGTNYWLAWHDEHCDCRAEKEG